MGFLCLISTSWLRRPNAVRGTAACRLRAPPGFLDRSSRHPQQCVWKLVRVGVGALRLVRQSAAWQPEPGHRRRCGSTISFRWAGVSRSARVRCFVLRRGHTADPPAVVPSGSLCSRVLRTASPPHSRTTSTLSRLSFRCPPGIASDTPHHGVRFGPAWAGYVPAISIARSQRFLRRLSRLRLAPFHYTPAVSAPLRWTVPLPSQQPSLEGV